MSMFKHFKRKKPEKTGEPQIGPKEVTKLEIDPSQGYTNGRYVGRLLNPDEMFSSDEHNDPNPQVTNYEAERDFPFE